MSVHASAPHRDAALLDAYSSTRDPLLRERLVQRYLPLARYAASAIRARLRAIRRPAASRVPRVVEGHRPLRPRTPERIQQLRLAHDVRRAAPSFPRPWVGGPAASRPARACAARRADGRRAAAAAGPLTDDRGDRRRDRPRRRGHPGRAPGADGADLYLAVDCGPASTTMPTQTILDRRFGSTDDGFESGRAASDARTAAGAPAEPRSPDPAPALRGGSDSERDRQARRALPDARLARDPRQPRAAARAARGLPGRRRPGLPVRLRRRPAARAGSTSTWCGSG